MYLSLGSSLFYIAPWLLVFGLGSKNSATKRFLIISSALLMILLPASFCYVSLHSGLSLMLSGFVIMIFLFLFSPSLFYLGSRLQHKVLMKIALILGLLTVMHPMVLLIGQYFTGRH
jgi:hypothetical protein